MINQSIFTNNYAIDNGGGIFNDAAMTVSHSTFTSNSTSSNGGGIYNDAILTVSNSTFTNNSAVGSGGGICDDTSKTLTVIGSSISGNSAATGGGLYVGGLGQAEIDSSTINDPNGGGIVNNGSTVHLKQTMVDGVLYKDQFYV